MGLAEPGAGLGDTSVAMWESELRAGRGLPMVCAVTGADAVGWDTFDCYLDPGHTDTDDEKFEGSVPVCARVLRRVGFLVVYSGVSLLLFVLTIVGIVVARWIGVVPSEVCGATTVAMWLSFVFVWPLARRGLPEPGGVVRGVVDGERWVLVEPVHPAFVAAVARLPRPRPTARR
jgi:hypothetical protein